MPRSRLMLLLLAVLLILQACAGGPAPKPPEPPATTPEPEPSPVTWKVTHTGSALTSPGGPVHLAPPYRFEIDFSAPVDRASVEAVLKKNLGHGRLQILQWSSDRRLLLSVEDLVPEGEQVQAAIDPTGGKDAAGKPLKLEPGRWFLAPSSSGRRPPPAW